MSIGFRYITSLLREEIDSLPELSAMQKDRLFNLCQSIYLLESSVESISKQEMISEIMNEITLASDTLKRRAGT